MLGVPVGWLGWASRGAVAGFDFVAVGFVLAGAASVAFVLGGAAWVAFVLAGAAWVAFVLAGAAFGFAEVFFVGAGFAAVVGLPFSTAAGLAARFSLRRCGREWGRAPRTSDGGLSLTAAV